MEVKVCKNCKKLFQYIYGPELCPECLKELSWERTEAEDKPAGFLSGMKPPLKDDEAKFEQVKSYIIAHPKATIVQIAEDNDIMPVKLLEWVRDDRLEFSEDSKDAWFECEICKAKIKSGRLCNRCKLTVRR